LRHANLTLRPRASVMLCAMLATACRLLVIGLALVGSLLVGYARFAPLPAPETMAVVPGTVVLDAHGVVLARGAADGIRIPVALDAIAPRMRQATISAEDRRFLIHPGVDPVAAARALLRAGDQPSGASTITQQLARRLYLDRDAGPILARKSREALLAFQLEANRSKREILGLYLNAVYYGRGAYGVEAAARAYFGISAANLDLAHAAYLAGLPQRPSAFEAAGDPAARARQWYVLTRMADDGWISRADADAAAREPITLRADAPPATAAAFVRYARDELARIRPDLADRTGLVIETTLDAALEAEIERLMRLRLAALADRNVTDGALVAVEPATGRILAMVGSATDGDVAHGGEINMAIAPRQPGSALKPLLYAAAFEHGFTPATPLLDIPTTFITPDGPYAPMDSDRSFRGVVSLRVALASSLNVPAVRTLDALGVDALLDMARRFGIGTLTDAERYGLALTLGGGEVRLLDLTNAYAALGAGGMLRSPFAVVRVRDAAGQVLYERTPTAAQVALSTQHAYLLADILSDADARIPGFGEVTPFELPYRAAAKSGTSTGFRDNWTLGFTPDVAIGVWVGNADGSPMINVSGVDGAGPIWHDAMMAAAIGRPMGWYARPPGIIEATACAPTGLRPGPFCPSPVRELFVAGTEPVAVEHYYTRDANGAIAVDPPAEARAWAGDAGLLLAAAAPARPGDPIRIVAPAAGSVFWFAPELGAQQLALRAAAAPGTERLTFMVDGAIVGDASPADPTIMWTLVPGRHTLQVSGSLASGGPVSGVVAFEVRR
jgi:penicillin-binding protein 1C